MFVMVTKKDRRHSGRRVDKVKDRDNLIYAIEFWSDWVEYRDGFRNPCDRSLIKNPNINFAESYEIPRWNKKLKRLVKVRKARKCSPRNR